MTDEEKRKIKLEKELALTPVSNFLEDYEAELGDGSQQYRGLVSGFTEIDDLISGLDRFILLAGRSGAGKTTLALQLALGVAERGNPVIIYSLEMSRSEIITKLLQGIAHQQYGYNLYANSIDLHGNDPKLDKNTKEALKASLEHLNEVGKKIYVRDSVNGVPDILDHEGGKKSRIKSLYQDVIDAKARHKAERVLVLIDSVQDIVKAENAQQTQAEVSALAELTILQQQTGATILATAQKNKASTTSGDDYADVMGSMSYIHKPNTVLMLDTPREMLTTVGKGSKGGLVKEQQQTLRDIENEGREGGERPMLLKVIKGRFTGTGAKPLTYFGAYSYFRGGKSDRYIEFYEKCGLIDD